MSAVPQLNIEPGVPLPPPFRPNGTRGLTRAFFEALAVGDSAFVPDIRTECVSAAGRTFRQRHAPTVHFACRARTENGVKGVRIWRTE